MTLPGWYLDGRQRGERNRRVDLAYATTGHRAQGLTRWRALVRLTGREDANWLYVQLSRARHETTLYPVVGPEPQGPAELDLPDREVGDGYDQLAQALVRAGDQTLAIDTPSSLDLRRLSTPELRAERDRLRQPARPGPEDRARELARASARRAEADQALEQLTTSSDPQRQGRGMLRLRRRGRAALGRPGRRAGGPPAGRPGPRRRADAAPAAAAPGRLAGGQRPPRPRPTGRSSGSWPGSAAPAAWPPSTTTRLPPPGARPGARSQPGRRAWRQAAAAIEDYRRSHQVTDPDHALGPAPREPASGPPGSTPARPSTRSRAASAAPTATANPSEPRRPPRPVDRHQQDQPPTRPGRDAQPRRSGPERAAG